MQQVLQAERDAEQSIQDCETKARRIIHDAQVKAQRILARADQRITNMEMRHGHKLDRLIRDMESQGAAEIRRVAGYQYEEEQLQAVISELAAELCGIRRDPGRE